MKTVAAKRLLAKVSLLQEATRIPEKVERLIKKWRREAANPFRASWTAGDELRRCADELERLLK